MPVSVIYLLKVIEINKQHAELISEARGTVYLRLKCLIEMTRVVKSGAIIRDREFLNSLHCSRILNGDSGVVTQRLQEVHLLIGKVLEVNVHQLDYAQHPQLGTHRHADNRPRLPLCHFIDTLSKARIGHDIRNDEPLAMFCHPSGNALAYL